MWRFVSNKQRIHIILSTHGTVTKTDQELDHKGYFIKFQNAEITQTTQADYSLIKLETQNNVRADLPPQTTHSPGVLGHTSS